MTTEADTAAARRVPALFLDRDGIVNVDHGYVHRIEDFDFQPGIFELVAKARAAGLRVVVVTNQAGIGRGYYGEAEFQRLTGWMLGEFARRDAPIDRVYHCPYHPEHGVGEYREDSPMRKPHPGMLLAAARDLGLDLGASVMVGDHETDITAGRRAGVARTVLVDPTGAKAAGTAADVVVACVADVAAHLF